jgi:hypothetical protein
MKRILTTIALSLACAVAAVAVDFADGCTPKAES